LTSVRSVCPFRSRAEDFFQVRPQSRHTQMHRRGVRHEVQRVLAGLPCQIVGTTFRPGASHLAAGLGRTRRVEGSGEGCSRPQANYIQVCGMPAAAAQDPWARFEQHVVKVPLARSVVGAPVPSCWICSSTVQKLRRLFNRHPLRMTVQQTQQRDLSAAP
jgi:hypothetical protein